jgi:catechol 2,3-dioxygenase-like lactoylglutathione lyase family enzyme
MADDTVREVREFDVGGVRLPRPFRIRRLGHFGVNVLDMEAARRFYCDLLGFRISDPIDFGARLPPEKRDAFGSGVGYFTRHGTDHHSFVLFPRRVLAELNPLVREFPQVTTNQITWQVGSLREVASGFDWFTSRGRRVVRSGRDLPGSNWHFYPVDHDGHINELYYGIEQVGWDGYSKPVAMHGIRYTTPPELPHLSELAEVEHALEKGIPLNSGLRVNEGAAETFDVGGVLLARPFKVVRIGPVRLFVADIERALQYYRDDLGLSVTEEVTWKGHRCVFLRANTEHHSLALYPLALRAELGLSEHSTLMSFGLQVGSYRQLRDSIDYLKKAGVTIRHLPPELFPGIDYCAFALDPEGHAVQLYYYMEQVGWDGRPRPTESRPVIDNDHWPDTVAGLSDSFLGEPYLGPLG